MRLFILNTNYEKEYIIDQCESILWNKKLNDVGYCEIYTICNEELLDILKENYYIYREDDDMLCQIESIKIETNVINGDHLTITANDISKKISNRVTFNDIYFTGKVCDFIKQILNENIINPADIERKITNFAIDESNFSSLTETLEISLKAGSDILETIKSICKTYTYGFKLIYNGNLVFKLYKGENKATILSEHYVEFSPDYQNIISSSYLKDNTLLKNVAVIGYTQDSGTHTELIVYNGATEPTGEIRKEIYIDGDNAVKREISEDFLDYMYGEDNIFFDPDVNKFYIIVDGEWVYVAYDEGEYGTSNVKVYATDYTYLQLLEIEGLNALNEYAQITEFVGDVDTIDTYEYKTDYNLGDYVKVINDYGISAIAQITEITESDELENGYTIQPKFEYKGVDN